jgi:hypothetical protein
VTDLDLGTAHLLDDDGAIVVDDQDGAPVLVHDPATCPVDQCPSCALIASLAPAVDVDDEEGRVTAADHGVSLTATAVGERVTANVATRTISGIGVRYNVPGRTSRGPLRVVNPSDLTYPSELSRVILTREHDRADSRGVLASLDHTPEGTRVAFRVADGPTGDDALREALDGTRAGLSYDVVDAVIDGDRLVSGNVIAFGQCAIPAYDDARIDSVAAAAATTEGTTIMLSPEQAARLLELQGRIDGGETLSADEQAEYDALNALNQVYNSGSTDAAPDSGATASAAGHGVTINIGGQPAQPTVEVAASTPAVPGGVPRPPATTAPVPGAMFAAFAQRLATALAPSNPTRYADVTAALADITHSAHTSNVEQPAWSGELWSGLLYEPQWTDLFTEGGLTSWSGDGWRFTNRLEIADYAGDKAAIPTDNITTESSSYSAARMAVGVDIDRKFFDFPTPGFVESLFAQVRESWAMKLDGKVRAYTLANAVAAAVDETAGVPVAIGANASLLKAAAIAVRALKRRKVGKATWVYVNDDDLFTLLDIAEKDVPVFLDLYGIDPRNFRSDELVPQGTVLAGVKPAATVRTLPGSPIRVEAQNLANGGVDEAFFGYWAIEEHHTRGIAKASFDPTP